MARKNVLQIVVNADDKTKAAFQSATQQIAVFSAAVTAALGAATQRAAAFETKMAEIQTLLGKQATPQIAAMRSEMMKLSRESGETLGALSKARYDIISAGFTNAADSANVLTSSMTLAQAGLVEVSTAADLMTSALNGLGIAAEDSGRVADVLFTIVREGKTTMPELAASLGQVFATAKVARVSLEEVGAAMATVTAKGIDTREAATALNNLLRALAAPTGESKQALDELGISLRDGLGPALAALGQAGDEGLDKLSQLIPNIRALKAAASAGSDIEMFNAKLEAMQSASGNATEAAEIMRDTLGHALKQLRQEIEVLAVTIGNKLIGTSRSLVGVLRRVVSFFSSLPDSVVAFSTALAGIVAVGGGVISTLGMIALSLNQIAAISATLNLGAALAPLLALAGPAAGLAAVGAALGAVALATRGTNVRKVETGRATMTPEQQAQAQAILDARYSNPGALDEFKRSLARPSARRGGPLTDVDVFGPAVPYQTSQQRTSNVLSDAFARAEKIAGQSSTKFAAALGLPEADELFILAKSLAEVGASAEMIQQVTDAMEQRSGLADALSQFEALPDLAAELGDEPLLEGILGDFSDFKTDFVEPMSDFQLALLDIRGAFEEITAIGVQDTMFAFSDAVGQAVAFGDSFSDVFTNSFKHIKAQLVSMIVQFIAFQVILKNLVSLLPGAGAGKGIGGFFMKAFGFATGGTVPHAATGMSMVPGSPGLDRTLVLARGGEMILSPERANAMRSALSMPGQGRPSLLDKFRNIERGAQGFVISTKSAFTKAEAAELVDVMYDATIASEGVR